MNDFQREIYKTIDILVEQKMKGLEFDKTKKGKVISVMPSSCVVVLGGEPFTCKLRQGLDVSVGEVVLVSLPQNKDYDRYVESIIGNSDNVAFTTIYDGGLSNSISSGLTFDGGGVVGSKISV